MKFLTRSILIVLLLISFGSIELHSQITTDTKYRPATISGKVTMKGKGVSGIGVAIRSSSRGSQVYRAITDQEGKYRISGIPPGSHQVNADAPGFAVLSTESAGIKLLIAEGESVEGVDFSLAKGGVITGRVTNSEGQPLIDREITLDQVDASQITFSSRHTWRTDDRGIFRIFGLSPGKYKVGARQDQESSDVASSSGDIRTTFHPDVTDNSKAAIVEMTEGEEVTGIDIRVETTDPVGKYAVTGRIIDSVTGQPMPNLPLGLQVVSENAVRFGQSGNNVSDTDGDFRVGNLVPGKYGIYLPPTSTHGLRADLIPFEIIDRDVSGLLLKTYRGASLSGQIVFETGNERSIRSKRLILNVIVNPENDVSNSRQIGVVGGDATFHVSGLPAGRVNFSLDLLEVGLARQLWISRIEQNGLILPVGFEIKSGEQVTGLKLVVNDSSGTIRGVVKVRNGELPPRSHISLWFTFTGSDSTHSLRRAPSARVDSRGYFVAEGVFPGTYELNAAIYVEDGRNRSALSKQQVTVIDGAVTEVTITIELPQEPR